MEENGKKATKTSSKTTSKSVSKVSKTTAKKAATSNSGGNPQLDGLIMKLARQHATNGISTSILQNELSEIGAQEIADGVNRLLTAGRLSIFKDPKHGLVYKEINPEEFTKFRGLQKEDMLIYQLIEQSGNKGIWTRDLKFKSNFQPTQITKILKSLEQRKLIKCVPLAQAKNKKIYMLYNIEPHPDVVGETWINTEAGEIDAPFIAQLNSQTLKYIQQKGYASTEEITAFIKKSGISKVEIKVENMQTIVDTLIFDGIVEPVEDPSATGTFLGGKSSTSYYKPSKLNILANGLTSTPCGVCPVFNLCSDEGEITPTKCIYYKEWLEW